MAAPQQDASAAHREGSAGCGTSAALRSASFACSSSHHKQCGARMTGHSLLPAHQIWATPMLSAIRLVLVASDPLPTSYLQRRRPQPCGSLRQRRLPAGAAVLRLPATGFFRLPAAGGLGVPVAARQRHAAATGTADIGSLPSDAKHCYGYRPPYMRTCQIVSLVTATLVIIDL